MFQIKICGITNRGDAELAVKAGADAIGLNFYPDSPRNVPIATAAEIAAELPATVARVGVFVNSSVEQIRAAVEKVGLSHIQLHGDESVDLVASLNSPNVIKAFRCRDGDVDHVVGFVHECESRQCPLAAVLIDAFVHGAYGGTGQAADWDIFRRLRKLIAATPIILAGGLRPDNVARAIEVARPRAVDTASGVESRPGDKDPELTTAFVAAAKQALAATPPPTG